MVAMKWWFEVPFVVFVQQLAAKPSPVLLFHRLLAMVGALCDPSVPPTRRPLLVYSTTPKNTTYM